MPKILPGELLRSLAGLPGYDQESFVSVHGSNKSVTSVRINPAKWQGTPEQVFQGSITMQPVPWSSFGYYINERPSFTFDPLFHAGCYYVQEASSMFLEHAIRQLVDLSKPLKVLDLCAAPGGKSTHLQSLVSGNSLLISNEVIRSRSQVLRDNIIKWGASNVVVTNNDPRDFAGLNGYFDLIVVDAPCSGSGLFRKDPDAIGEWSENNVAHCSQRQQRILADIWPALKENGLLLYSTCSYSKEENEDILAWILKEYRSVNCKIDIDPGWGITETEMGYRFWPDKVNGEGFFLAAVKKTGVEDETEIRTRKMLPELNRKEKDILSQWMEVPELLLVKNETTVYAWPFYLVHDIQFMLDNLNLVYSGVRVGELIREKLVPDHALGMSGYARISIPRVPVDKETAINYCKRKDLQREIPGKGWQLILYEGHALGWVNVLPNRVNNYYPKELRIIKDNQGD